MKRSSQSVVFLMELTLTLLIFALGAAVCLRLFVAADSLSRKSENLSCAVRQAQSAAEVYLHTGGDLARTAALLGGSRTDRGLLVCYDGDWREAASGENRLELTLSGGAAEIAVYSGGEAVFSLTARAPGGGT